MLSTPRGVAIPARGAALQSGAGALLKGTPAPWKEPRVAGVSTGLHAPLAPSAPRGTLADQALAHLEGGTAHIGRSRIYGSSNDATQRPATPNESKADPFRRALIERYGSLRAAWDSLLDYDRNGKISFAELQSACQEIGYATTRVKDVFNELDDDTDGFLEISDLDPSAPKDVPMFQGVPDVSCETLRYLRYFLARARRRGAHGIHPLGETFRAAASSDGCFDAEVFTRVALSQGLANCRHECICIFRYMDVGDTGRLHVERVVKAFRGSLSPHRAEIVRGVWRSLDRSGSGVLQAADLLAEFHPRFLPRVRSGEVDASAAIREFMEGLGVSGEPVVAGSEFALEEVQAKRRPRPAGALSAPLHVNAGRPGSKGLPGAKGLRTHRDVGAERSQRTPVVHLDAPVSLEQFEAYYAVVSSSVHDEDLFEKTVCAPWTGRQVHEQVELTRRTLQGNSLESRPANFKVMASFEDGTRSLVILKDDHNLQSAIGGAGADDGQIWTWGREINAEVVKRLTGQGISGVRSVNIMA